MNMKNNNIHERKMMKFIKYKNIIELLSTNNFIF